jgi:DNA-binding NarL/FixJ family response regulator
VLGDDSPQHFFRLDHDCIQIQYLRFQDLWQPVLRDGLSLILGALPDMAVVAQASTGEEALDLFLKHEPNVLQMPGEGAVNTVRRLLKKRPGARF